ncbi:hypothetical protein [Devosia sp. A449]
MMGPTGGRPTIGPFFDLGLLKAILEEMAQLAAQAGANASHWFDTDSDIQAIAVQLRRLEVSADWLERYYARPADRKGIDAMKRLLEELAAAG